MNSKRSPHCNCIKNVIKLGFNLINKGIIVKNVKGFFKVKLVLLDYRN